MSAPDQSVLSVGDRCAWLVATCGGVGLSPVAPGLMGALAALPLHWLLVHVAGVGVEIAVVAVIGILGVIASQAVARQQGNSDPQIIVIDEFAGVLIALIVAGDNGVAQAIAFVAFRVLDIAKPWPIDRLERLSHFGLAVMADDIAAGLAAAAIVWAWLMLVAA